MNPGMLMQLFPGDPTASLESGAAERMNRSHRQQTSKGADEFDGAMSFGDVIRRMRESEGRVGDGCADVGADERWESKGLPPETLLAVLGHAGLGALDSVAAGQSQPSADAAGANFWVRLNEHLSELTAALGGASADTAAIDADIIGLLNDRMSELAAWGAAVKGSVPCDFKEAVSLLQTAIDQRADQPGIQSLVGIADDAKSGSGTGISSQETLPDNAKLPALLDGMPADRTADSEADDPAQADGSTRIPIRVERLDASSRTLGVDGRTGIAMTVDQGNPSAGKRDKTNSMGQASTPETVQTKSRQESDKPLSVQQPGQGKTVQRESTVMEPFQTTASPTREEKKPLRHTGQHQPIEQAPARSNPSDSEMTETRTNASMRFGLSADSAIQGRASATPTAAGSASMSPSGETAFQKTVMDQIVEKASLRSVNDRSEMRIHLKPDSLGDVRMSIVAEKNQMVVQMIADKSETKEIIESQLHHLKTELDRQGITVGRIEVTINSGNDQQGSREQFFQMFKEHTGSGKKDHRGSQGKQAPSHQHRDESETAASIDGINYFV